TEQLLALLGYADAEAAGRGLELERPGSDRPDVEAKVAPGGGAQLLSLLALEAPLVVIVDDLHDASPETVDELGSTLSRLTGPILVSLLGRPERGRTPGAWPRLADAEVHALPALRGAEAARLLTA